MNRTDTRPAIVQFVERLHALQARHAVPLPESRGRNRRLRRPPRSTRAPTRGVADRLDRAARRAPAWYPGPVGALIQREIRAFVEFGHRFGSDSLVVRVADEVLAVEFGPADGEVGRP